MADGPQSASLDERISTPTTSEQLASRDGSREAIEYYKFSESDLAHVAGIVEPCWYLCIVDDLCRCLNYPRRILHRARSGNYASSYNSSPKCSWFRKRSPMCIYEHNIRYLHRPYGRVEQNFTIHEGRLSKPVELRKRHTAKLNKQKSMAKCHPVLGWILVDLYCHGNLSTAFATWTWLILWTSPYPSKILSLIIQIGPFCPNVLLAYPYGAQ